MPASFLVLARAVRVPLSRLVQWLLRDRTGSRWIPAFAGMTMRGAIAALPFVLSEPAAFVPTARLARPAVRRRRSKR